MRGNKRRGARAVEWAGLENRNTRKCIVGSNPTLSANLISRLRALPLWVAVMTLVGAASAPAAQNLSPEIDRKSTRLNSSHRL